MTMRRVLTTGISLLLAGSALAACEVDVQLTDPGAEGLRVVEVVDGDTVKVSDGRTVRIIGIDSPETRYPGRPVECWGPEATEFAEQTLDGQEVTLVPDPTQDATDRYGRTLAYVDLQDGRDFSVLAAESGSVRTYVYDKVPQRFRAIQDAENRAKSARIGLWSGCAEKPRS